jgi:hypothetical protein
MATRCYNIPINQEVSTRYASDLNDQEFALLAPHVAQKDGSGKKRTVDIREVLNAIFYRVRTGDSCLLRRLAEIRDLAACATGCWCYNGAPSMMLNCDTVGVILTSSSPACCSKSRYSASVRSQP